MPAFPTPPLRPCTRRNADGSACTKKTIRADGWCGKCDGFVRPSAPSMTPESTDRSISPLWEPTDASPLPSDEAYTVVISRAAQQFARVVMGLEELTRDNAAVVIRCCAERAEEVRASLGPVEHGEVRVTDASGLEWVLAFEGCERPTVRWVERAATSS